MILLPNEEKLVASNGDKVIFTTNRIRMTASDWYGFYSIVLFPEDISSIEIKYKGNIIFLILGCLGISSGLYFSLQKYESGSPNFGFIGGIALMFFWWF